jgi:hypothetical protein
MPLGYRPPPPEENSHSALWPASNPSPFRGERGEFGVGGLAVGELDVVGGGEVFGGRVRGHAGAGGAARRLPAAGAERAAVCVEVGVDGDSFMVAASVVIVRVVGEVPVFAELATFDLASSADGAVETPGEGVREVAKVGGGLEGGLVVLHRWLPRHGRSVKYSGGNASVPLVIARLPS